MIKLLAQVTAAQGLLVFDCLAEASSADCVLPMDKPGQLGCLFCDSAKHVGISPEALELLKTIKPSGDAIGDVDWFKAGDKFVFCWLGGPKRIGKPSEMEGSRDYIIGEFVDIPNDVPEEALAAILAQPASE